MEIARIKKADDELQIFYCEVYAPNRPDSDTDFMLDEDVRTMAHNFMRKMALKKIDTQHDNSLNGSYVVESWVQQEPSEIWLTDAWVVGIKVPDDDIWDSIKKGEITGVSIEALVEVEMVDVEIDVPEEIEGTTIADTTGHVHKFTASFGEDGMFQGGKTDTVDGHYHVLSKTEATKTQKAEDGHFHRVHLMEGVTLEVSS